MVLANPAGAMAANAFHRSTNTFIEIDDFAPVQPRIDVADRTANRATQVSADIDPIPIREIIDVEPAVVVATIVIGLWLRGPRQKTMIVLNPSALVRAGLVPDQ
jgi:hypothetical protein